MKRLKVFAGKINKRKVIPVKKVDAYNDQWLGYDGQKIDSVSEILSLLVPVAVKEFTRLINQEVDLLCGKRYSQGSTNRRWGSQAGSIFLANQKVRVEKPRVRNYDSNQEMRLQHYEDLQNPNSFDETAFINGLIGVSKRNYAKAIPKIASSFGFTKSSISRRCIKTMEKKLRELNERDIGSLNIISVIIDGKRFRDRGAMIAMGISEDGHKHVLGIYESNSENSEACNNLLSELEKRGLSNKEILFVVDGGSGLNKALEERHNVDDTAKRSCVRVRCFVHKWNNIKKQLPEEALERVGPMFWSIRDASTMDQAKLCSDRLEAILQDYNLSALNSYLEAKADLLNIHRLRLTPSLKKFFSTTNAIESLNSLVEEDLRRVKRIKSSKQFQYWLASSCLEGEKKMKRVRGYKELPALKVALSNMCNQPKKLDIMAVNE